MGKAFGAPARSVPRSGKLVVQLETGGELEPFERVLEERRLRALDHSAICDPGGDVNSEDAVRDRGHTSSVSHSYYLRTRRPLRHFGPHVSIWRVYSQS